jgi:hypothetical protein
MAAADCVREKGYDDDDDIGGVSNGLGGFFGWMEFCSSSSVLRAAVTNTAARVKYHYIQ